MQRSMAVEVQCNVCDKVIYVSLFKKLPGPPTLDLAEELTKLGWASFAGNIDVCSDRCYQIAVRERLVATIGTGVIQEM
jgi:hypothetical protein